MKKYLPLILLLVGIVFFVLVFFFIKNQKKGNEVVGDDESTLIDVPLEDRPVVSLIPSSDGHYLKLKVDKIKIDATSVDYELLYQTEADITQGTSGFQELNGAKSFEKDLLLGTESSGKFRYDEGVEVGSIELKFRKDGKLYAKFKSDFHLQKNTEELTSLDGKFTYTLEDLIEDVLYLTMPTVGIPEGGFKSVTHKDGYAVFSSELN